MQPGPQAQKSSLRLCSQLSLWSWGSWWQPAHLPLLGFSPLAWWTGLSGIRAKPSLHSSCGRSSHLVWWLLGEQPVLACSSTCSQGRTSVWLTWLPNKTLPLPLPSTTERYHHVLVTEERSAFLKHTKWPKVEFCYCFVSKSVILLYHNIFKTLTVCEQLSLETVHIRILRITWREMLGRMKGTETGLH